MSNKKAGLLEENNYVKNINSFSLNRWKPLLDLIPAIEKSKNFGEMPGGTKNEEGTITFPHWIPEPVVIQCIEIVYEMPIIINFAWSTWDEGRNLLRGKNFDFDTVDIPTKCKIITAIVRQDRFVEGTLVSAFESGLILRLLISIRKQLENPKE